MSAGKGIGLGITFGIGVVAYAMKLDALYFVISACAFAIILAIPNHVEQPCDR